MGVRRRRGVTSTTPHDEDNVDAPPSTAPSRSHRRKKQPPNNNKRPKQQRRKQQQEFLQSILPSLHPKTRQAVAILLVAMLTGMLWNWWEDDTNNNDQAEADADPTVQNLLRKSCQTATTTTNELSLSSSSAAAGFYCHPSLVPTARTQKATRFIRAGQVILKVPRQYQIWDLDAFVDNPVVRQELVHARIRRRRQQQQQQQQQRGSSSVSHHDEYEEPLPSAAFLAAHLALLFQQQKKSHNYMSSDNRDDLHEDDSFWQSYWNVLPTYEQYQQFHPLLWTREELQDLLGGGRSSYQPSYAYTHVMAFWQLLRDEYTALVEASTTFASLVAQTDYFTARLHVMTRSFGTGPVDTTTSNNNHDASETTMRAYADAAGISWDHGFHAMVPILDLYNHHANPNVGFGYDTQQQSFVITAVTDIAPGDHIRDSYGKRTDADLFARYGFVNGDGSDWTQASLALWHIVQIKHPEQQQQQQQQQQPALQKSWSHKERSLIARYLQYDDGYEQCVGPPSNKINGNDDDDDYAKQAWQLKRLKYRYLLSIAAADETRWVFHMSPRAKDAKPDFSFQGNNDRRKNTTATQKHLPPALDLRTIQFDGNAIFGTCRLLTLTHVDYQGNATEMLKVALQSELGLEEKSSKDNHVNSDASYFEQSKAYSWLPPTQDALEYRTLLCVARIAATALQQFGVSIAEQQQQIRNLSVGSKNWTVAHIRLGEMQSLDMLKQVAFAGLRRTFGEDALKNANNDYAYQMRDRPCPLHFLRTLVEGTLMDGLD